MEDLQKYITLVEQDLTYLSPRERTAKMKAGQAKYLYSLLDAGVTVNFVEYLVGTIEEMDQQRLTRTRQRRFQHEKRKRCPKPYTHCRMCSCRLVRMRNGVEVETATKDFDRAFCRGGKCKKKLIATKPVHRVVRLDEDAAVPQPEALLPATPIADVADYLEFTVNKEGVKRLRAGSEGTRRAPKNRKAKSTGKLRRKRAKLRRVGFTDVQLTTFAEQLVSDLVGGWAKKKPEEQSGVLLTSPTR